MGLIPDDVTGFSNYLILVAAQTVALGPIQPPIKVSIGNLSGHKDRLARKNNKLAANYDPIVWKMWEPRRLTTLWASTACYKIALPFMHKFVSSNVIKTILKCNAL
jgi:hypothetical protein